MSILVTGGAGYIGSHVVRALGSAGRPVAVIDDLSSGHRDAVPAAIPFLEADVADRIRVPRFMREHGVDAIMHFAGLIQVGESVTHPRRYFSGNLAATLTLLELALDEKIRSFIFSSTAAVYGEPESTPIAETHPTKPINAYGITKLVIEAALAEYARAYDFRFAALRYFNAAGAEPHHRLGERHHPESHLIPILLQVASGSRADFTVNGDDYDTPDGTCIRDYIHVSDLASAHLAALQHLERGGASGAFNLGAGFGSSVRAVIEMVRKVTGQSVPTRVGMRREGDAPRLVADTSLAAATFGFRPRLSSLERIVRDAWEFEQLGLR